MKFLEGLTSLLPGDSQLGYVPFSQEMYKNLSEQSDVMAWAETNYQLFIKKHDFQNSHLEKMNKFLIYLKSNDAIKFKQFRFDLLDVYFKSYQHKCMSMRPPNDPENVIIFDDIEFDLLEPVLERGEIWRDPDNEKI